MTEARVDLLARMLLVAAVAASVVAATVFFIFWNGSPRQAPHGIASVFRTAFPSGEALPEKFSFALLDQPRSLPRVQFIDSEGRVMTMADFRGRVVLLNLWATWCVPCRKEMPTLDRLQAKLGGPDFKVVPLSIDRQGVSIVKAFYQELKLRSVGIYVDQSSTAATRLGAMGIPTTLLLDRDGREVGRKMGPAEWDSPAAMQLVRRYLRRPGIGQPAADRASVK